MPKFNSQDPNVINAVVNGVIEYNNNLKIVSDSKTDDMISRLRAQMNSQEVLNIIKELDVPADEESLRQTGMVFYAFMMQNIAKNINEGYKSRSNPENSFRFEDIDKLSQKVCFDIFENLVKSECGREMMDYIPDLEDDCSENWKEGFTESANDYFSKNAVTEFGFEKAKAFAIADSDDKEVVRNNDRNYTAKLNEQIENFRDSIGKNADNRQFNYFMSEVASNYTIVHDLYNKKSLLQKWFTKEGRQLRQAMNDAKTLAGNCYDKLAKENSENAPLTDKTKCRLIPDRNKKFDISKEFRDFTNTKKISLRFESDMSIERTFYNDMVKTEPSSEERKLLNEEETSEIGEILDSDKEEALKEANQKANKDFEKGYENFEKDLEDIKDNNDLSEIKEEDEDLSLK